MYSLMNFGWTKVWSSDKEWLMHGSSVSHACIGRSGSWSSDEVKFGPKFEVGCCRVGLCLWRGSGSQDVTKCLKAGRTLLFLVKWVTHTCDKKSSRKVTVYWNLWYEEIGQDFTSEWICWKMQKALSVDGENDRLAIFHLAHSEQIGSLLGNSIVGNPSVCFWAWHNTSHERCTKWWCITS